jgi:hypothetical protein
MDAGPACSEGREQDADDRDLPLRILSASDGGIIEDAARTIQAWCAQIGRNLEASSDRPSAPC